MKNSCLALCLLALACSNEGAGDATHDRHALASARAETLTWAKFAVASPAFAAGGAIPLRHSAYGDGLSPALTWSGLPAETRSVALMMEDPDARSTRPFVHWLAWNVDPALGGLPEGVTADVRPAGMSQGRNSRGGLGYFGPRPPGSLPHHYHFQLFALDAPLRLAEGADREALLAAMRGHVVAKGELVGLFGKPGR
jgi:Raf kinase inhibitor-like YbhB/YbcL family protein